ncbi:unnamed protein product, partial [Ectocarpus sp. 12 AP-2014]
LVYHYHRATKPENKQTNCVRLIVFPRIARTCLEYMTGMARFSRGSAITTALLLLHAFRGVEAQTRSVCEGELGEANWACDTLAPLPSQVFDGQDELLPLPGSPDAANPVLYKQISGEPV